MDPISIGLSAFGIVGLLAGGGVYAKSKAEAEENAKQLARYKEENDRLIQQGTKSGAADSARLREQEEEIKRLTRAGMENEKEIQRLTKSGNEQSTKIKELTTRIEESLGALHAAEQIAQRARNEATEAIAKAEQATANTNQATVTVVDNPAQVEELNAARKVAEEAELRAMVAEENVARFQEQLNGATAALEAAITEREAIQTALVAAQQELETVRAELIAAQGELEHVKAELSQSVTERENLEKEQDRRFQKLQDFAEKQVGKLQEENRALKAAAEATTASGSTGSDTAFQSLATIAAQGIFIADAAGNWTFASENWTRTTGLLSDDSKGAGWLKAVFESDRPQVAEEWKQAVAAQAAFQKAFRLVGPSGSIRWVSVKAQASAGNYVGIVEDVTEFRRIEEGMKSANLCLRSVVEAAMEGIVLLNKRGDITSWNRAAARMFGYSEEESKGRSLTALLVPDDRPTLKKGLEAAAQSVATNHPHAMEVLALCKDGRSLPIEVSVAAWTSGDVEGGLYYTATMRDVTERRQAEDFRRARDAAEESNRAKSQFLANMSHELRTPLNAIIGFSEILHDRTFGDLTPKQDRYVGNILTSGRHLLQLINDILDLSKVEAGHVQLEYAAFPVAVAIRNIENMVKVLLSKKNITLNVEVPADLPVLVADQAKFKQIIYNLVSNAIKFTPDGGTVTITAWAVDNNTTLQVAVKDTGIGIKPEDQERVFREFEQVDNSYARQQQGTGLGLALVRRFVHMHGGKISVFSEGEGKGTTFTFTCPFAPPEEHSAPAPATEAAAVTPPTAEARLDASKPIVLVVEDDQNASELLTHHLQMAGYVVSRTGSSAEAVTLAQQVRPNLVTLDVQLADGDGWEVLQELKKEESTRGIPVIMVSIVDDRDRALAMGAVDTFTKPVNKERLLASIARSLQAKMPEGNATAKDSVAYPAIPVQPEPEMAANAAMSGVTSAAGTATSSGKRNTRSRG